MVRLVGMEGRAPSLDSKVGTELMLNVGEKESENTEPNAHAISTSPPTYQNKFQPEGEVR
jgi:hypothetical protein